MDEHGVQIIGAPWDAPYEFKVTQKASRMACFVELLFPNSLAAKQWLALWRDQSTKACKLFLCGLECGCRVLEGPSQFGAAIHPPCFYTILNRQFPVVAGDDPRRTGISSRA